MAWMAPMTAVTNTLLTASQFNVHVRDNLLETEAGRAVQQGWPWFSEGPNRSAEHQVLDDIIETAETTTNDEAWDDLDTEGPAVEIVSNCGFLIMINCQIGISTVNDAYASYEIFQSFGGVPIEGGWVNEANFGRALIHDGASGDLGANNRFGAVQVWAGVDHPGKGTYTVRMKYRVSSNDATGTFQKRRLQVMAI